MAKKFGKLVMFGVAAGAALAGTYYYLQKKKSTEDDFEDLDKFDDDPAVRVTSKREYISLDSAKAFVTDTFEKAKDTITKVGKKFTNVADDEDSMEIFDVIEEEEVICSAPETAAENNTAADSEGASKESENNAAVENNNIEDEGSVEEFFDDEEA